MSGKKIKIEDDDSKNIVISFWRPTDPHGEFGQWYVSNFTLSVEIMNLFPLEIQNLNLITEKPHVLNKLCEQQIFNTAEKFMMMGKASLFEDDEIFDKMKIINDPARLKMLGRKVSDFDQDLWELYCMDIVKIGNYLKFSQKNTLKQKLLNTKKSVLVEGSPMDKVWGVGLRYDDPKINDPTKWKGTNYLGKCLMYVREILK